MDKQKIREKTLDKRRSLTSRYIEDNSDAVFERLLELDAVKNAKKVLVYSNFDNEVKTAKLTGWLLFQGKSVYLPTIEQGKMYAAGVKNAVLEMSKFGVAQPKLHNADLIEPEKLDLVIVPGVAFDERKNRIGFGMGYYDAFLAQAKRAYKLALAYDFQVVKDIPADPHDVKMDCIVLPDRVID